jgi:hypothetical protein
MPPEHIHALCLDIIQDYEKLISLTCQDEFLLLADHIDEEYQRVVSLYPAIADCTDNRLAICCGKGTPKTSDTEALREFAFSLNQGDINEKEDTIDDYI